MSDDGDPPVGPRQTVSSWLSGARSVSGATEGEQAYPGERLGLPQTGPGSVVSFGRRLVALLIDWLACYVIAWAVVARVEGGAAASGDVRLWNSLLFLVEVWVLTSLGGGSFGQRLRGLRVQRLDGSRLGSARCLARTLLIMLVIPPLIWDRDGRGLHDRVVDSVVVHVR